MKRIPFIIPLSLLAAAGLFATGEVEEQRPDKLVYLTPPWGAPSDEVVAVFEERSGIELEVATVDIGTSRDRVLTATAGRTNPADVIFVSADTFAAFQSAGAIRALDELAPAAMLDGLSRYLL